MGLVKTWFVSNVKYRIYTEFLLFLLRVVFIDSE